MKCPNCNHEFPLHQRHSKTSTEAGRSRVHSFSGDRLKLWRWLSTRTGGATDEEMVDGLDMNPNTQRPRRVELVAMKKVKESGETRPTRSGHKAVVWEAMQALGCKRWLALGQHWNWCGETDMGQGPPNLCTECGGVNRLESDPERLAVIGGIA